jgi:hypothetical protein
MRKQKHVVEPSTYFYLVGEFCIPKGALQLWTPWPMATTHELLLLLLVWILLLLVLLLHRTAAKALQA